MSVVALMNVALRVIDDRFDDPLMVECREAGRFVEQFMNIFIRSVRFHLKICHGKRLFQKLSQKFAQIVNVRFDFFSRWNGRRWNGNGRRIYGSWRGMDGRRSRHETLSALFLLVYRVFYGFNYILTARNRIFILKSIITWWNNQWNQFPFCLWLPIATSKGFLQPLANHNMKKSLSLSLEKRIFLFWGWKKSSFFGVQSRKVLFKFRFCNSFEWGLSSCHVM